MKVKELAEKLNKSIDEVKRTLQDMNVTVKNSLSTIDEATVTRIIEKYNPPKTKKVLRVIKKADLAAANVPTSNDETLEPITAGQKAIRVIAQENQKKKDDANAALKTGDKDGVVAIAPAGEVQGKKEKTLAEDGVIRSEEVSISAETAVPVNPLETPIKENTHQKKEKEKSFQYERTFAKEKEGNILNILKQKPKKNKSKYKRMRQREEEVEVVEEEAVAQAAPAEVILKEETISVTDFAKKTGKSITEIISLLLKEKILLTINQKIDISLASRIGELLGIKVTADYSDKEDSKIKYDLNLLESSEVEDTKENIQTRPPIVTIMGHVDHGKTKLLDTIRSSRVMEGEAGGITQHIGAYQVEFHGKKLTFLDTPGHEAFTALRARGAQVTDVVILVVAANDGIMPQTVEAIDHAKAAGVPIIVAINKIDLPEANVERVKQQLTQYDLVPEAWGGKTVCCEISAKQKIGIDTLLDMVLLTAEVENLQANPNKKAQGIIIESRLSKERGPSATVLIKAGTLHKGDPYVIGATYGRVRAMFNDLGKEVKEAPPSFPVEIIGISEVPRAGEIFQVLDSEKEARTLAESRASEQKDSLLASKQKLTLASLTKTLANKDKKTLNIVLKADVQGSLEALINSIEKIHNDQISVNIIHSGTGIVNESDVMLAKASEAVILAFNLNAQSEAENLAAKEEIEIRSYNIIYKLLEDLELALTGMLQPEYEEIEIGQAVVRSLFKSSKFGSIAGAFVTKGSIKRNASKVKLFRNDKILHEGKLATLKRFKDDVKEVQNNLEFGFTIEKFNDYKEGDIIVAYETREKPRGRKNVQS